MLYVLLSLICWIVIYPLDSIICPLYNWTLVFKLGFFILVTLIFFKCFLQAGKHDAIVKNIHDLLAKLAWDFSAEQLDHLFSCFQVKKITSVVSSSKFA